MSVSRRAGPLQTGQVVFRNSGIFAERRAALLGDLHLLRQQHRQRTLGQRDYAAGLKSWMSVLAVDHRDRCAPVTLAADAPVLQPVGYGGVLQSPFASQTRTSSAALQRQFRPSPLARVDQYSVLFSRKRAAPAALAPVVPQSRDAQAGHTSSRTRSRAHRAPERSLMAPVP